MADNWAAFKTSEGGEKEPYRTGTSVANPGSATAELAQTEGDDDWADFGGFESASPASNVFGNASPSSGFPWATAFPAVSQRQPIQPPVSTQPRFPVQTSALPSSAEKTTNTSFLSQAHSSNLLNDAGEYTMLSATQSGVPMQMTSTQSTVPAQQQPTHRGLPTQPSPLKGDIASQPDASHGTGTPTQQVQQQAAIYTTPNVAPSNVESAPPIPPREHRTTSRSTAMDDAKLNEVQLELKEANEKVNNYENKLQVSEEKLSLAEREKIRLEKSLEEMKAKISEATNLAKEQYLEIERQKELYDRLQDTHEEQLKKLREAGQESFAIIVEEYKELSKTAVAQERERNEKHLQQLLEEEREKFTTFVNQQGENLKLVVKEEQANNLQKLEEALDEQKTKHQAQLNESLEEERKRGKDAIEKAVEEERARAKAVTEELLSTQKNEFETFVAEQKKIFEENLVEERKESAKKIEEVLKEEQERAKNDLDEAMAEEREKSRDAAGSIREKSKEEMGKYIKEKEKADEAVRLRSYQSMDLFLQGVQTQLRSLMNGSDIPPV